MNKDSYKIFSPSETNYVYPLVQMFKTQANGHYFGYKHPDCVLESRMGKFLKVTRNLIYIKCLAFIDKNPKSSYHDIWQNVIYPLLKKPKGHDFDLVKNLPFEGLTYISDYGKYKAPLYASTVLGKRVLDIVAINENIYRVIRHFVVDPEEYATKIINEDLMGDGESWNDLSSETVNNMIDKLFDPNGDIQTIGSHFYWINKIMSVYKASKDFRDLLRKPETTELLAKIALTNQAAKNFKNRLAKFDLRYD